MHANVEYGLRVRGVPYREAQTRSPRMLRTVGLSGYAEAYPYQLSGGMRQRVALARALANDPEVLLARRSRSARSARRTAPCCRMSCSTSGTRPGTARAAGAQTILFVTHSIDEALVLGDRVLVMTAAPGRIKAEIRAPFARRAAHELKRDPVFGELSYQMQEALRDEVGAASLKNCAGKDEATTMKNRALNLISPVAFLVIWELLVALGALDRRFFPAPSETLARLLELLQNGELTTATVITLRRMAVGFVLAAVPAVVIGLLMGANRMARIILGPLITALYPVPKIALVPMVVILLGIGETSKVAIVAISVFFLVVIHTMAGVLNVEQRYFDIARNNGARPWDLLTTVAIPASLPNILTGINLALGFALTVIVGTELLLPQGGLGALIWKSYNVYDIPTIFAGLIVVALLGWAFTVIMGEVERQLLPWRVADAAPARRRLQDEPRLRRFVRTWWLAVRPLASQPA